MSETNFYSFSAKRINGQVCSMEEFKGKIVVVVNTASKCGLTPQYEGLEKLYLDYKDQDLVVLGFPCNQFAGQEPGSSEQINEFCQVNYGVSFPMFEKIEVNGSGAHPLFKYLKKEQGGFLFDDIKWNFTKFLIDREGNPVERFAPTVAPKDMEPAIQKILSKG